MASTEPSPFREFSRSCDRFAGLWRSIDIRAGTIKVDGKDFLLHLRVRLDPREPDALPAPPYSPTVTGRYTAHWEARPISDLPALLGDLERGELHIGESTLFAFERRTQQAKPELHPLHWTSGLKARGTWLEGTYTHVNESCVHLSAWGQGLRDLAGDFHLGWLLEHEWRSLQGPFLGEKDVLRTYFGLHVHEHNGPCVLLHCVAPIPVELGTVCFRDGALRVEVRAAPTAAKNEIRVGYVTNGGERREAATCDGPGVEWTEGDPWHTGIVIRQETAARDAVVLLQYRGVLVEQAHAHNPALPSCNPAVQLHQYFDPDRRVFRKRLYGDVMGKPPDNFEAGVAWVLALCDLPPIVYANTGVHGEVDLVAYLPAERLFLCVECTAAGPAKEDKLGKLYKRCREIAEALEGHEVLPVLATPWSDSHLTEQDYASAREKSVALLTRENLAKLEDIALRHAGRNEALAYIRQCVPKEKPPEAFGISGSRT